ncbi:MAG: PIN domain-containing protein, partial [Myxococcota bacterium]
MAESTQLPAPADPESVHIIDISGYIFRAYHALPPLSSSRGEPTHAVRGVVSMLMKLFEERKPTRICVAVDARGRSVRRDRFPEYKANRDAPPPDLVLGMENSAGTQPISSSVPLMLTRTWLKSPRQRGSSALAKTSRS